MEFISALPPRPLGRVTPYLLRYLNGPLKLELFSVPLHSRLILLD